jgi:Cu(I)/Ag(I) efflux system membrane fusion protein
VRPDASVEARVAGYPDAVFKGRVGAILPELNAATRTLRARIELANPQGRLRPGMFATISFPGVSPRDAVLVPSEALIRTGERSVVIVDLGNGKFRASPVQPGGESAGQTEILKGVQPGDKVVVSGQFLIDSEASLTASAGRMEASGASKVPPPATGHLGRGRVTGIDANEGRIELDHEPIASLKWPRMTMSFMVEDKAALGRLGKGDTVEFALKAQPGKNGEYVIESVKKLK